MARNLDSKCKQCRREGIKLFLKGEKCFSAKCPLIKRDYPPGFHGPQSKRKRLSSYSQQLREKQKAKRMYRLLERQFKNYYLKAVKVSGDTSENLLRLLERRLDNVVYRLGFAISRDFAGQLINHGHITVNGKKITIPSYQVKIGQEVGIKKSFQSKPYWQSQLPKLAKVEVPSWLSLDPNHIGKIVSLPKKEDLTGPFDPTLIIEFYSR